MNYRISKLQVQFCNHLWDKIKKFNLCFKCCADNNAAPTEDFIIGDRVWVAGTKPGQIAYIGETQFAPGDWAGIVLDEPIGKLV